MNQQTKKLINLLKETLDWILLIFGKKTCMEIKVEDLTWCDVVQFVRSTDAFQLELAKYAKKIGKFIIFTLDDDFLSLDDKYGSDGRGYRKERKECLKKILGYVDVLITVNKLLAEKYTKIGGIKRYTVGNTIIDAKTISKPQKCNGKTKIVIYENDGSTDMFDAYIKPTFGELCAKVGSKIEFYFMALHPELTEFEDKTTIYYIPHMGFDDFLSFIRESHFEIGLAPLNDIGFSKYKYFNKYIEYTRGGIAGIYSDCALYRQVVTNGYNGILCNNTKEEWLNAIVDLVNNDEKRVEIANNAQTYANNHFSVEALSKCSENRIDEYTTYEAPHVKVPKIKIFGMRLAYYLFRFRGWIGTFMCYVKAGKFKQLLERIKEKMFGSNK